MTAIGDLIYQLNDKNFTATVLGLVNDSLTELNIPTTVTIKDSLDTIYTIKAIGNDAFNNKKKNIKLKIITFDKNSQLETIGDNAFYYLLIENITIPETVTTIGENAFFGNFYLKSIKFLGDKPYIGRLAFATDGDILTKKFVYADTDKYPNWKETLKIDNYFINKKSYYIYIVIVLFILIILLSLLSLNGYYFTITHKLLTNILIIIPILIIIILLGIKGFVTETTVYRLGIIPLFILSLIFVINTLVKSKWSFLFRLPMSFSLLGMSSIISLFLMLPGLYYEK